LLIHDVKYAGVTQLYGLVLFYLWSWKQRMREKYSLRTFTEISFRR